MIQQFFVSTSARCPRPFDRRHQSIERQSSSHRYYKGFITIWQYIRVRILFTSYISRKAYQALQVKYVFSKFHPNPKRDNLSPAGLLLRSLHMDTCKRPVVIGVLLVCGTGAPNPKEEETYYNEVCHRL